MQLDEAKILQAIQDTKLSPDILEEGARLVDHWIQECGELDERDETLAVEAPFFIELDPNTFTVGTEDRIIRRYTDGKVCGCEWKTAKHQTKFWNADAWLESISQSHQVATYGMGLRYGQFVDEIKGFSIGYLGIEEPEILVRAISKSYPPVLWPSAEGQFLSIAEERIWALRNTYRNTAEAIRGMRATGQVPWQVPGLHCTNMFRKVCPHLKSCLEGGSKWGQLDLGNLKQSFSPTSQRVIQRLIELGKINEANEKDVVILSSSTLSDYQQCAELWRRNSLAREEDGEENEQMNKGSVLHAGLGEFYKQMMKGEGK